MTSALVEALSYREHGYALLPLSPRSKKPFWSLLPLESGKPSWAPLAQEAATERDIIRWFSNSPEVGIGIIGGDISGGIAILDIDDPKKIVLPNTPIALSHETRLHAVVANDNNPGIHKYEWGSIIGEGGYAAAPPSIHPNGFQRRWVIHPNDVDPAPLSGISLPSPREREGYASLVLEIGGISRTREDPLAAEVQDLVLRHLGIHVGVRKPFRCVLPGHEENNPSATLIRDKYGFLRYHDWHCQSKREFFSLPEIRASQHCGEVVSLNRPSIKRWWDRMMYEIGVLQIPTPPSVALRGDALRRVADGFYLLVALREESEQGQTGAPYTRSFVQHWCAVSEWDARASLEELMEIGFLRVVGYTGSGKRPTALYDVNP